MRLLLIQTKHFSAEDAVNGGGAGVRTGEYCKVQF